ncbi:MAG TPA: 4a-hydroxytetrahydrobiopterin dehydratase [Actinomycetota bacterium]|nr:4a-hydroxytetrahydrobiopterin dehydratase [Actinomycetota bacterium]
MSALHEEHPHEYPKGTPPLDPDEARTLAELIRDWTIESDRLTAELTFKDFQEAFSFVNRVALLAEAEGHHPDISISWNRVKLEFWTHTAEGLTRNDFIMAAKIDRFRP